MSSTCDHVRFYISTVDIGSIDNYLDVVLGDSYFLLDEEFFFDLVDSDDACAGYAELLFVKGVEDAVSVDLLLELLEGYGLFI